MKNLFLFFILSTLNLNVLLADSFEYNSFNNHGVIGLINMPNARFYPESSYGVTIYDGTPDQKITLTSFPFDWMEASFFYTNIQGVPYCGFSSDPVCDQDYKDKGFNLRLKVKDEGLLPAIAIGFNDIAGTGFYSSEYIVASYGVDNVDLTFGVGWGSLDGASSNFKNPLGYLDDRFLDRPEPKDFADQGGQFQPSRYFSGETISPFYGISYVFSESLKASIEYDSTVTPGEVGYDLPKSDYSFGIEWKVNSNFSIKVSQERGNYTSASFIFKNNPQVSKKDYKYKKASYEENDSKYKKLIKNIENNGIGVNKIVKSSDSIGIELTQFTHSNLDIIEEIIASASIDAGIEEEIKKDLRIVNLKAVSEIDETFERDSEIIYERKKKSNFYTSNNLVFRPFIAAREEFFKGAFLIENNSEYVIRDSLIFSSNLKYSIADNFDDLTVPPVNTYPAQVRSDVKDYLRNIDNGVVIGRAQLDYYITPKKNNHLMFTAGILEEMFSGYGLEYLYFKANKNYAFGFEIFEVKKRDYEMRFGHLDYENITGSINYYHRNYKYIPFDAKISYGEYLAGDEGFTIDFSRSFKNGTKFGVFATFTDVSSEDFGEGTFDKGVYFNIPIFGNFINYSWRPLTKDPGAKLIRKNSLHDLLIKFKPIN